MSYRNESIIDIVRGTVFLTLTAVVLPVVLFSQIVSVVAPGVGGA